MNNYLLCKIWRKNLSKNKFNVLFLNKPMYNLYLKNLLLQNISKKVIVTCYIGGTELLSLYELSTLHNMYFSCIEKNFILYTYKKISYI